MNYDVKHFLNHDQIFTNLVLPLANVTSIRGRGDDYGYEPTLLRAFTFSPTRWQFNFYTFVFLTANSYLINLVGNDTEHDGNFYWFTRINGVTTLFAVFHADLMDY